MIFKGFAKEVEMGDSGRFARIERQGKLLSRGCSIDVGRIDTCVVHEPASECYKYTR